MTSLPMQMIRHAADGGPRMRIAVQDAWTAIRPVRTIIQDRWMALRTAIRGPDDGPGRTPAARTASWKAWQ